MPTYFQVIKKAKQKITDHSLDPYVAVYLMQRRLRWNNTRLLMNYPNRITEARLRRYRKDVQQYINGESPQYIIGTAPFYGYNFRVNHHVLIPRPETEGLVDWILTDYSKRPLRIVDVGTGSGAIAIALKLQRPSWNVTATDISVAALKVAERNANDHHVRINFKRTDLFTGLKAHSFDVIVSNPPYVSKSEIHEMGSDVIRNEPHVALFAGHHGMAFYQRIAVNFSQYLKLSGSMYLEIGFREKKRIGQLFNKYNLKIRKDLARHPRMVKIGLK